jgi:thiamine transport system substrate-binding protein
MFVFPVNRSAALPDVFVRFAQVPAHPITMDPATIEAKREQWIEAWTRTMRR